MELLIHQLFRYGYRKLVLPPEDKRVKLLVLFFCLFQLFQFEVLNAATISIPSNTDSLELSKSIRYFEDAQNELTIESILQNKSQIAWSNSNDNTINLGYSDKSHWFHVTLKNKDPKNNEWLLETDYAQISHYDIFIVDQDRNLTASYIGTKIPNSVRYWKHRHFITPLNLAINEKADIYIRIRSEFSIQLPLHVWKKDAFVPADQKALFLQALFFGIAGAMVIYNFFLVRFTLDISYGYYVAFVVMMILFQALQQGIANQYFPILTADGGVKIVIVVGALALSFSYLFIDNLLALKQYAPKCHYFANAVALFGIILVLSAFVLPPLIAFPLVIYFSIPASFCALAIGFIAWSKKSAAAPYFVAAWTLFLTGNVLLLLNRAGVIPRVGITEYSQQIGTALEVILLSIALADRINTVKAEKAEAEKLVIASERRAKEVQAKASARIEQSVIERTDDMAKTIDKLESANEALTKENILDGLTGSKNRRYFDQRLQEDWKRAIRNNSPLSLLLIDLDHFKNINDTYGHLFGDYCLVETAEVIESQSRREEDLSARFGGEEFAVILPGCEHATAQIIAETIRNDIEKINPETEEGTKVKITASIGLATITPQKSTKPVKLITESDKALYRAKASGRNRVCS